ncbi:MAG: hypothetical protein GX126_05770 [Bacteroidales bacterium]|nr:hypothetical protein [Bacteroidales bacterium]
MYGDKRGFTGKYTDPKVYDELEEITGIDRRTIQDYKTVSYRTSAGRHADLGFSHHREVAKLPPEKQETYLKKASEENLSVRDLREQVRKDSVTFTENIEMPNDKYDLVYADPPWQYGNSLPNYVTTPDNYYPLMSIDQICQMPIKEIINKDAVLFLWVTSPMLQDAFKVIEAWGFKYKTSFVWDKIKHNMGHYSSVRHEFLLLAIRGSYPLHNLKLYDSVYSEERTEHSKKPQFYYQMIEDIYCNAKKIELFSREKREGWYSYGNQL